MLRKLLIDNKVINLDYIKSAKHYSDEEIAELISLADVGTDNYDYIIERLYFYDPDDRRNWKNRADPEGYAIVPTRSCQERAKEVAVTFL